jgi:DNA polymerase-1
LRTLLVDADSYAYELATRASTPFGFSEDIAIDATKRVFDALLENLDADKLTLCLSDRSKRYFRHDILGSYKSHRTQGTVPAGVDWMKDHFEERYEAVIIEKLEADDVCGIFATDPCVDGTPSPDCDCIVVSGDKDLLTLPTTVYNPRTQVTHRITPDEANYNHLYQTLTGDSCDGFKGLPRVGPVKAKRILDGKPCWECVVEAFEKYGLTEADALIQAQVARICRFENWDFTNRKVIPWTPPTVS